MAGNKNSGNPNPSPATRFKPGNTIGTSNKPKRDAGIACWAALLRHWQEHGDKAIQLMYEANPVAYVQLVASGAPTEKSIDMTVSRRESLSEEQSRMMAEEILERHRRRATAGAASADSVHDRVPAGLPAGKAAS